MKKNFGLILAIGLGLSALLLTIAYQAGWVEAGLLSQNERAVSPTLVSYQGQIWDGATPYDGPGYFKFAIIDSFSTQTWSNDGNDPPTTSVPLTVENGLFSVNLGAAGMAPISESAFPEATTFLRVWFSPNNSTWTQMPDQQIASVPYALRAQEAYNASYFDNMKSSDFQLRVTDPCPSGQAIKQINADGSVLCEVVSAMPRFTLSMIHSTPGGDVGYYPSVAIGGDGLGVISYNDYADYIRVAHCADLECTSASNTTIDSNAFSNNQTSIAVRPNGSILVSYYDYGGSDLWVAYCSDLDCSTPVLTALDTANRGWYSSIAVNGDVSALVSYSGSDVVDPSLYVASCSSANCSSFVGGILIDTLTVGGTDIAYGTDSLGLIAYISTSTGSIKVAHCSNLNCTARTVYTPIAGHNAKEISLAIGSDGLGLISFRDDVNGYLKVAHCNDLVCSSANVYTLDNDHLVGYGLSLDIGMDGLGIISYYNDSGDLRTAHCINLECSAAVINTLLYTDDLGYPRYWTAITTGMDGMPLIAYQRRVGGTLNSAHCSNLFCMPTELP